VCGGSLRPGERYPDPLFTSTGHEPPLSRLAALGYDWVLERPEHLVCNWAKLARTDQEMTARERPITSAFT
jgi:hypothetical protein